VGRVGVRFGVRPKVRVSFMVVRVHNIIHKVHNIFCSHHEQHESDV